MPEPSRPTGRVPADHTVEEVEGGKLRRVRLRTCTSKDRLQLVLRWGPLLERGPRSWLDRDWSWDDLDGPGEVAFSRNPEFLVLADEVESDAHHDFLGVLVTTGPVTQVEARLGESLTDPGPLLWVEYVAIAPSLRRDCPGADRRKIQLKAVGQRLTLAAIERSRELGCDGRVGLHAEGPIAELAYERWNMRRLAEVPHPAGGTFPVYFGSSEWANRFSEGKGPQR